MAAAYSGFSRTTSSNFCALPAALRKPGEARAKVRVRVRVRVPVRTRARVRVRVRACSAGRTRELRLDNGNWG
eukprot:scaffold6905_cov62-Phaeocystis_antarctica.AAC.7